MERVKEMDSSAFLETINILLLEDNAADVELLSALMLESDLDCTIAVVDTYEAFFSTLNTQPIDIVLADYSLPTFDGLSAIGFVEDGFPDIPCIVVSGVLGEDLAVEALKGGAADYVLKDNLARLVPAVKRALREQRERKALLQATADLQESEIRFRTSVETMADCFIILSSVRDSEGFIQDFTVSYLNAAACKALSVSQEKQLGKSVYTVIPAFKATAREDSEGLEDLDLFLVFCGVIETGYPFTGELFVNSCQSSEQPVVVAIQIVKLDNQLVVTWRDITQKKQDERRYLQLLAAAESACNQLERANQFKDNLLGSLSNELRSPLSTIMGWLEISSDCLDDKALVARAIQTSYRNAEVLDQLIEDLLDVSRMPHSGFQCRLEPLSIDSLVCLVLEVVDAIAPAARNKDIEIVLPEVVADDVEDSLLGDASRLKQVFRNLLSNALKFTPAGGRITISFERLSDSIVVLVQDTGIGIASEEIPHLFERFWQGEHTLSTASVHSAYAGLGLGLSIVRHIVLAHGGQVSADSAGPGQGSSFRVELPLASQKLLSNTAPSKASSTPILATDALKGLPGADC